LAYSKVLEQTSFLYTPARPILELPVSTNFCAGFTKDTEGTRFCLRSISLQPHFVAKLEQPTPTKDGGLLLRKGSCTRLFNFDLKCSGCHITARIEGDVTIIVNDMFKDTQRKGEDVFVTISEPIHLRTLDICIDDKMDCLLCNIT
ncbi:hypothetical protein COOONC_26775, partial [Cooperia oncophora]